MQIPGLSELRQWCKADKDDDMMVRLGLRFKFTLLFLGLMGMISLAIYFFVVTSCSLLSAQQHYDYAMMVVRIVEDSLDSGRMEMYLETGQTDQEYDELVEQMKGIQESTQVYYLYVVFMETMEQGTYFFDLKLAEEKSVLNHSLGEEVRLDENYPGLFEILASDKESKQLDTVTIDGETLNSAYVPLIDENGQVRAFVGVDFKEDEMITQIAEVIVQLLTLFLAVMFICFCMLLCIVQFSVLRPVYRLKRHAEMISEGKFDVEVKVRGHDELSEISTVFNRMAKSIAGNMKEMQDLNDVYYKYVPSKILSLLGKSSIMDIGLGNEADAMLSVFAFQMLDFDKVIRKKQTKEMIDSINQVLNASVPVIVEREGMVESFSNAGFTAVFDHTCQEALESGITICQKLNHMVLLKQLEDNQAGIGIAYGPVTMGIVGHKKRMAAITVSQYKDTAVWLQSIAGQYQSHILITRTAADTIPDFFETYHVRTLGFLYNTYTGYTDRIYDVYDGDTTEEAALKTATKEMFEKGVEQYCIRNFREARQYFIAVLKQFRKDKAAKEYLYLCDKYSMEKSMKDIDIYFTKVV